MRRVILSKTHKFKSAQISAVESALSWLLLLHFTGRFNYLNHSLYFNFFFFISIRVFPLSFVFVALFLSKETCSRSCALFIHVLQ